MTVPVLTEADVIDIRSKSSWRFANLCAAYDRRFSRDEMSVIVHRIVALPPNEAAARANHCLDQMRDKRRAPLTTVHINRQPCSSHWHRWPVA